MWETKNASQTRDLRFTHLTVGTVPVALTNLSQKFVRGILLRSPGPEDVLPNRGVIYIGDCNVTVDTGLALVPGGSLDLPCDDASQIYAVASAEDQDLAWMGV